MRPTQSSSINELNKKHENKSKHVGLIGTFKTLYQWYVNEVHAFELIELIELIELTELIELIELVNSFESAHWFQSVELIATVWFSGICRPFWFS